MGTVSSDPTDVIKQLDYIEVEKIDKDGNAVIVRVYWHNYIHYATLKFYDFTSK